MIIEVTQDDIDKGERNQCESCPVARAIQRHYAHYRVVVKGPVFQLFSMVKGEEWDGAKFTYPLPDNVQYWIDRFDKWGSKGVKPITFELDI